MLINSDLKKILGQLFLIGFDGTSLPDEVINMLEQGNVAGVILFKRNMVSVEQVAELNKQIYSACNNNAVYPFIAVDQEGGRVSRIPEPFLQCGPFSKLGKTKSKKLACKLGCAIGKELLALGFNLNFAPVLDVATNPINPVIGDRALSNDVAVVSELGCAFAEGLENSGIIACGKHFPGHGDTTQDSHYALPILQHDIARLEAIELKPFVAAITKQISALMTAHVIYTELDTQNPATLSKQIVTQILRKKLGFNGVIFSDDLEMAAVAAFNDPGEIAVKALVAGVDVLLFCHNFQFVEQAKEAIKKAISDKRLPLSRVTEAATRVLNLKQKLQQPTWKLDNVGKAEHKKLLKEIGK